MKPKLNYKPGKMDECQTPSYALTPLIPFLNQEMYVWEPANGEGYLSQAITPYVKEVICTDLLNGINFFETTEPFGRGWDFLITNPPFSLKFKWMQHCYELGKPFALLVPVETIGAKSAQKLTKKYGVELMFLSDRVDFKMPNKGWDSSAQFPVMWLCHNLLPEKIMYGDIEQVKKDWKNKNLPPKSKKVVKSV